MLHADNERILTLMSQYLCFTPCAIAPEDVRGLAADCGISLNDAYIALLAAHCNLNTEQEDDGRLFRAYFPRMVRQLDPADYAADAYLRQVRAVPGHVGGFDLVEETVAPMELFVRDDFAVDQAGRVLPQLGWFAEPFTFPAVRENGRVWMTVTPNEINTMRPCVQKSRGNVLTFGLGLGYYAFHALLRPEVERVTVVERSEEVIRLFEERLLPFFPKDKELRILRDDAFAFAARPGALQSFDTVFTDLWHDVADGLPLYRRMRALEQPGPQYLYWIEPTLRCYLPVS